MKDEVWYFAPLLARSLGSEGSLARVVHVWVPPVQAARIDLIGTNRDEVQQNIDAVKNRSREAAMRHAAATRNPETDREARGGILHGRAGVTLKRERIGDQAVGALDVTTLKFRRILQPTSVEIRFFCAARFFRSRNFEAHAVGSLPGQF